jgi:hypothetical protein
MLLALYWGSRKETLCASQTCWEKTRVLLAQAGLQFAPNQAPPRLLADPGEDSPQNGLRYSLKAARALGARAEQASVHLVCGAWASASNALLLNLPTTGEHSFEAKASAYLAAFDELVELWDPREGIVCLAEDVAWTGGRLSEGLPCVRRYRRGLSESLNSALGAPAPH